MGCDIHMYVEQKVDGKWVAIEGPNPDIARYLQYAKNYRDRGEDERAHYYEEIANDTASGKRLEFAEDDYDRQNYGPTVLADWLYDGRNYDLFAILADVRNGRGFAGMYTGEGFNPIADPKGVPEDMSEKVKAAYEYWESDGHSHSWLTLKELEEYDWDQKTQCLKPGLYPSSMSEDQLKENLEYETYKDSAGNFYTDSIPALRKIANGDSQNVRIVFWFDN